MNDDQRKLAEEVMPEAKRLARKVWLHYDRMVDLGDLEGAAMEAVCRAAIRCKSPVTWPQYAMAYAYRAASREARRLMREQNTITAIEVAERLPDDSEQANMESADRLMRARIASVSLLTDAEYTVFTLWVEGSTRSAICKLTGMQRSNVHRALKTAFAKIREVVK